MYSRGKSASYVILTIERSLKMGIFSLFVSIIVFILAWIPLLGVPFGIVGSIVAIILGSISLAVSNQKWVAGAGLFLALLTLTLKLIPGVNLL
jgi:glucose-6-phosphate-specific signal transduction histidine kinase